MQKCMYCGVEISPNAVLTVCEKCGHKVWGQKMFETICKNMEDARDNGDLCHLNNTCSFESETKNDFQSNQGSFSL